MPLIFVTQNQNKLDDAKKLLPGYEIEHIDFDIPEIQSMDPREIIEHKLRFAYEKLGKPCFVMDASLGFEALNGFPGPFIKFWFHTVGEEKTYEIVKFLENNKCKWISILGYFDGTKTHFIEETTEGTISTAPIGMNGYHWDTIFMPIGETKTLAQMSFEEKQKYAVTSRIMERFKKLI